MKIQWSEEGRESLAHNIDFIAARDVIAAQRMALKIQETVRNIGHHPYSGRIVPEFEVISIREKLVTPFRIIYLIRDEITILAIIHGRRQLL